MSATTPDATGANDAADLANLEKRDVRALTEYLSVVESEAPGFFTVYSEAGEEYTVDIQGGACECPDAEYRGATCKHQRAAAYLSGARELPEWVDTDDINAQLCETGGRQ